MTVTVTHSTAADGTFSAQGALAWDANHTLTGLGTAAEKDVGVPNGVATLDAGGKVPVSELPAAVLGALSYQGTWDASTNTPTLTSSTGTKGYYYVVSVAGTTDLNGVTDWQIGDWAVYNGTAWQKVDNTDAGGDVVGPASATDNAVARFNLTTGKLIQNSAVIIDDSNNVTGVNTLTATNLVVNDDTTLGGSNTDTLDVRARITSDLEPNTDAAKDIGTSGRNWRDGFFSRNLQAEGKVVSPHFDALNSAGGSLRNASGTAQLQWGGGGGNNISVDVAININPANSQVDLSPTGTGTVRINPATASSMNNVVIGATTPLAITGTTITATNYVGIGGGAF
jgi:hypothetical protein